MNSNSEQLHAGGYGVGLGRLHVSAALSLLWLEMISNYSLIGVGIHLKIFSINFVN